jgi:hypothetical protein
MNQVATVQRGASLRPSVSSSASPETIPMSTFNAPSGSQANAPGTSGSQANAPGTSGSQANAPGTNQATPERRQSLRLKEAKNKTPAERKSSDPK